MARKVDAPAGSAASPSAQTIPRTDFFMCFLLLRWMRRPPQNHGGSQDVLAMGKGRVLQGRWQDFDKRDCAFSVSSSRRSPIVKRRWTPVPQGPEKEHRSMPKLCRLSLVLGSAFWLFAAAGAHAVRPSPLPQCSTSCTQYSPCEINLSTTNVILTEATLFSVRARANVTFTGTGTAETRNVPGFYFDRTSYGSGLATFKLRFTPTQVGTYHYETFSAYAGLGGQVGDFTCSAAVPLPGGGGTNRGFLRRDPNSAYSYSWDDGTRFLLWGQTYYQIVNQARRNTDNDAAWKAAVDNSRSSGMNKVRLLVSPWTEDPFKDSMGSRAAETQPYCTGSSSSACEVAAGALDFTRVNLDHFVALDEVVHYLFGKGTIAEIIIFRDPGPYGAMVSGNMDQNKQYLRYVTARYAAYPNVTWSL